MPALIPNQRHLFDIPEGITYLNCAYMSPLMKAAQLAQQKIFVSARGASLRITPYLYNTDTDIDRLVRALHRSVS